MNKKFGKAPIDKIGPILLNKSYQYTNMIFMDKDKEKEWEDLDPQVKKSVIARLEETCAMMENRNSIQLLCHVVNELTKRIEELEAKCDV